MIKGYKLSGRSREVPGLRPLGFNKYIKVNKEPIIHNLKQQIRASYSPKCIDFTLCGI